MTRLLKITDLGSGIMVQGTNNVLYPDNATLTYPYNSIIVVTDESNIATFRSASNNAVLFSGLIGKIEIGGEIVTKENINTKFDTIANKESGGGGSFADASYDSQTKRINFYDNGGNIVSYIDATGFIKDGMVSNVAISEGNLVITFNTDAGQEPISIALTDIFNSENYYNKTEVDGKLALKADKSDIPDTSDFLTKEEYNPKELATAKALTQLNETKADKTEIPDVSTLATKTELNAKQDTLVSGTNIKTINNQSILGSGNITINDSRISKLSDKVSTDTTGYQFSSYFIINNMKLAWGHVDSHSGSGSVKVSVNFPSGFKGIPIVLLQTYNSTGSPSSEKESTTSQSQYRNAQSVRSISSTGFTFDTGNSEAHGYSWVAIGRKPS